MFSNQHHLQRGTDATANPGHEHTGKQNPGVGHHCDARKSNGEEHHAGQLVLVLGSTGNKGESRRKDFGQVIEKHPRLDVILTTDDSNREDPKIIADEIASFVSRRLDFELDRELAIKKAVSKTKSTDDAVIIAGKGTDMFQLKDGKRQPYIGDTAAAQKYL